MAVTVGGSNMIKSLIKELRKKRTGIHGGKAMAIVFIALVVILTIFFAFCICQGKTKNRIIDAYAGYAKTIVGDLPYPESARFAFGYLNNDNIPELFIAVGTGHAEQIAISSYNQTTNLVEDWGSYSSFGTFDYYEKQGVVVGQYGGMGYWYHVYEELQDGYRKPLAISCMYIDTFFWAQPYEGTSDEAVRFDHAEEYIVTESEYLEESNAFLSQFTDEIHIDYYENMLPYTEDSFLSSIKVVLG